VAWLARIGRLGFGAFDRGAHALSRLGRGLPLWRGDVEVTRDLPFADGGDRARTLDLFRPRRPGPHPVVFYVHGGAFLSLSKDTHWPFAMRIAERGYLVCNINYRLGPTHRFPLALVDCIAALDWLAHNANQWNGDLNRLALVGESAGANLITALAICLSARRDEPWARPAFDLGLSPRAVAPLCGLLHASGRSPRRSTTQPLWYRAMRRLLEDYAPDPAGPHALLDPLLILENGVRLERRLPPFFIGVGARDPLLEDSERLHGALRRLEVPVELRRYPGEGHAFQLKPWRSKARECWRDLDTFLKQNGLSGGGADGL